MTFQYVEPPPEQAFLVGVHVRGSQPLLSIEDSLDELALLARTAGMEVVGQTSQTLNRVNSSTFIGSGKLDEILQEIDDLGAPITIIFDDELSPRHQRELSKRFGNEVKLLDRSALILDIFAQHASTREGALQVELAQYEYRLPRLTRQWTHLARQAGGGSARGGSGGVGLRGPGETQLEVDRREISRKITHLKTELEQVRRHRSQYRARRRKTGVPVVALVGYTNAGKSTLLNAISDSNVYTADQLFATLDPTTRRVTLPSNRQALFTDTVGFIQKLPTSLIAAFRATLEEINEADMLLHVVDVSHPNVLAHIEAVEDTLAEIDTPGIPQILVWNKMDRYDGDEVPDTSDIAPYDAQIMISARKHTNIDELLSLIDDTLASTSVHTTLLLPYHRGDLVSVLFESARVEHQQHTQDGVLMTVELPHSLYNTFSEYVVMGDSDVPTD